MKETNTEKKNGFGVASLVLGILSLLFILMPYFGLPLAIMALVFSYKQNKTNPTGQASAGNVLGIIGTVLNGIVLFILLIVVLIMGKALF
jgi:Domain of unknown function (DUF4190)